MQSSIIVLVALIAACSAFRQQSVGVKGRLLCGDRPIENELVKLINHNTIGSDDQLATAKTDKDGFYTIQGGLGEILSMDVKFKIFTNCNDGIKPCKREITLGIPGKFVTRSDKVQEYFNGGELNLQFHFKDESRSCFN
ncbi:Transthyretin-like protein 46 [Toxocara canis]|uniref:Transthyretin-like protein 46 n=2 Tax=Toxocara canis TaxID=6265 RepID=A0A0B2VRM5_TOXCA|nr:Transthyretin-like protein 46 [Toxocara canis]VDM41650.1 unnamed protein product [Toxocara canis]